MKQQILCFLLGSCLLPCWFAAPLFAETPEIRLEGIAFDANQPQASVVVINGDFYELGSKVDSYEIVEIQERAIRMIHAESGEEQTLYVEAKKPEPESKAGPEPAPPQGFLGKVVSSMQQMAESPSGVMGRAWELMALRELATINNASVLYYNRHDFFPRGLNQLILDGFLDASYEEGIKAKYRFYFDHNPNPNQMGIHADPVEPDSGLRYFFVGPDAVIREAAGKAADSSSPPHDF